MNVRANEVFRIAKTPLEIIQTSYEYTFELPSFQDVMPCSMIIHRRFGGKPQPPSSGSKTKSSKEAGSNKLHLLFQSQYGGSFSETSVKLHDAKSQKVSHFTVTYLRTLNLTSCLAANRNPHPHKDRAQRQLSLALSRSISVTYATDLRAFSVSCKARPT